MGNAWMAGVGSNCPCAVNPTTGYYGFGFFAAQPSGFGLISQTSFQYATTAAHLWLYVSANTGGVVCRSRVNGSTGNQVISTAASATGAFEDTSHSDVMSSILPSTYDHTLLVNGAGAAASVWNVSATFTNASGNYSTMWGSANPTVVGSSNANPGYFAVGGSADLAFGSGQEQYNQLQLQYPCTLTYFSISISTNTMGASMVFRVRKNGANGNQSVTFTTNQTGTITDAFNTDTFAVGDLVSYQRDAVSTTGSYSNYSSHVIVTPTGASPPVLQQHTSASAGGAAYTGSLAYGVPLWGNAFRSGAGANIYNTRLGVVDRWSNLQLLATSNTATFAVTVTFVVNGSAPTGGPKVVCDIGASGRFMDVAGSYISAASDLAYFAVNTGSGSGTASVTLISIQQGAWLTGSADSYSQAQASFAYLRFGAGIAQSTSVPATVGAAQVGTAGSSDSSTPVSQATPNVITGTAAFSQGAATAATVGTETISADGYVQGKSYAAASTSTAITAFGVGQADSYSYSQASYVETVGGSPKLTTTSRATATAAATVAGAGSAGALAASEGDAAVGTLQAAGIALGIAGTTADGVLTVSVAAKGDSPPSPAAAKGAAAYTIAFAAEGDGWGYAAASTSTAVTVFAVGSSDSQSFATATAATSSVSDAFSSGVGAASGSASELIVAPAVSYASGFASGAASVSVVGAGASSGVGRAFVMTALPPILTVAAPGASYGYSRVESPGGLIVPQAGASIGAGQAVGSVSSEITVLVTGYSLSVTDPRGAPNAITSGIGWSATVSTADGIQGTVVGSPGFSYSSSRVRAGMGPLLVSAIAEARSSSFALATSAALRTVSGSAFSVSTVFSRGVVARSGEAVSVSYVKGAGGARGAPVAPTPLVDVHSPTTGFTGVATGAGGLADAHAPAQRFTGQAGG